MKKNLVCAIYNHPEAFPPTLNAIRELSNIYNGIYLVYRPNLDDNWRFPDNVFLIKAGSRVSIEEQARLGFVNKGFIFLCFTIIFFRSCIKYKPQTILVYDSLSLLCYHIFRKALRFNHLIWYHNHDVEEPNSIRKYSLGWWASKSEKKAFGYLSIFSLPSNERRKYFNLTAFKGEYFFLPNFPSCSFYKKFKKSNLPTDVLRLLYQGTIAKEHGIEEVMAYVSRSRQNIKIILIGNIKETYKISLTRLSEKLKIQEDFEILKPVSYSDLPPITASGHIGMAINKPSSIIYSTGGTSSNKIYEYAAMGLPVLYFDNEHYKNHLDGFSWALPTDLSIDSLEKQIKYICFHYEKLSADAIRDFGERLNFEKVFSPLYLFLQSKN